jgi:hypothetical protein
MQISRHARMVLRNVPVESDLSQTDRDVDALSAHQSKPCRKVGWLWESPAGDE